MAKQNTSACYSVVEHLTIAQQQVHDAFTNYLRTVCNLKAPEHLTESLERRTQIFIRQIVDSSFSCVYDCQDSTFLTHCREALLANPDWSVYNHRHAGTIASSLGHYVDFLQYTGRNSTATRNKVENIDIDVYSEGAEHYCHSVGYERNRNARLQCIAYYGCRCYVCGFDFEKVYGELGKDYIEVHHVIPVSKRGGSYEVDPVRDLRPLCSNCHSMIHRKDPVLSIEELKQIIDNSKG